MGTNWLDRTPVIVGIGEIVDRPSDPHLGKEPLALMADALRLADEDAGGGWLARVQSLDVVNSFTWGYRDLPAQLCDALAIHPGRTYYGPTGGESPIRYLNDAAIRISRGEIAAAAVCGGEAAHTLARAEKEEFALPWTPEAARPQRPNREGILHPSAIRNGLIRPLFVYPIYEYASRAAWGQSHDEAQTESAALWSKFSAVAAANPYAWLPKFFEPEEIATASAKNRKVAGPYTKLMVAFPTVNQAAAILVTSLGRAKALGIPEHKLVYIWGGSAASEPRDIVSRDQYAHSTAMDTVLDCALGLAEASSAGFDFVELYSCFPCVPKMARRQLGLPAEAVPTVAGSLTFFGAPLNNYMSHATTAMSRRLRQTPGSVGLLFGQGEFVTRHHALVVASRPPSAPFASTYDAQTEADRRRGPAPPIDDDFEGTATAETCTVFYTHDGTPDYGVVFARTAAGSRLLGRVEDHDTLAFLTDPSQQIVGARGSVRLRHWAVN